MSWQAFTPVESLLGGILIGLSAAWMLAAHGRIAGISGILGGLLSWPAGDALWRVAFLLGLVGTGAVVNLWAPGAFESPTTGGTTLTVVAGLLVGTGTRMGSGCTSGHGVCGVGRLSARSMAATATFIGIAMLATWLRRTLLGGL